MSDVDVKLARLAAAHKSVIAARHAHAEGISDRSLYVRRRSGLLLPLYDGVYRHAAWPYTPDTRLYAALLACGDDALVARRSAAVLHRFPGVRRVRPEIMTPHSDLPRLEGVTIMRTRHLDTREITRIDGFPVTSKGRTALDLCGVLPFEQAQDVLAEAIICKVLTVPDLVSGIELGGGRGCAGTVACRTIAAGATDLDGLESLLELAIAKIVDRAGVPRPIRQYELTCADGREVRLDNAWPELRLAAEGDGVRWHGTPSRLRRSQARSRSIQASGWVHLVYGWADAHTGALATQRDIEWHYTQRLDAAA